MKKVSVYCLAYNHEKYLRDALEGFVMQKTDFEYEVFVHDDASTDGTADIIREYEKKYPDIIHGIYQTENQSSKGISIYWNYIYPRLTGEYVASCEGDDYWCDCEKLACQVAFLDSHKEYVACVHNTRQLEMSDGTESDMYSNDSEKELHFEDVVQGGSCCYHTSSLMLRRSIYQGRPGYLTSHWDYPLSMFLSTVGRIHYINRTMSVYRHGTPGSYTMTTVSSNEKVIKNFQRIINMLALVDEETKYKHSALVQEVILRYRFELEMAKGNYEAVLKEPLRKLFKQKSVINRVKIITKCVLKRLHMVEQQ